MTDKISENIFKAYDIRGKYPKEINESVVVQITQSIINHFLKKKGHGSKIKMVVGHDARLSSPKLYCAIINQLKTQKSRIKIASAGLITTPMLYFLANHLNTDLGIIITASHNPKEYNGLKIVGKNAVSISGKEAQKLIK